MEVLLRHKAFKPKAMAGGASMNSKAFLGLNLKTKSKWNPKYKWNQTWEIWGSNEETAVECTCM